MIWVMLLERPKGHSEQCSNNKCSLCSGKATVDSSHSLSAEVFSHKARSSSNKFNSSHPQCSVHSAQTLFKVNHSSNKYHSKRAIHPLHLLTLQWLLGIANQRKQWASDNRCHLHLYLMDFSAKTLKEFNLRNRSISLIFSDFS